jgi:hypothetical protein
VNVRPDLKIAFSWTRLAVIKRVDVPHLNSHPYRDPIALFFFDLVTRRRQTLMMKELLEPVHDEFRAILHQKRRKDRFRRIEAADLLLYKVFQDFM